MMELTKQRAGDGCQQPTATEPDADEKAEMVANMKQQMYWQGEGKSGSTHRVHHRIIHPAADSDHGPLLHGMERMIRTPMISRKMDMAAKRECRKGKVGGKILL
jgi:hypothetical protein